MTQADIELLRRVFGGQWTVKATGKQLTLTLNAPDEPDPEKVAAELIEKVKELVEEVARLRNLLQIRG